MSTVWPLTRLVSALRPIVARASVGALVTASALGSPGAVHAAPPPRVLSQALGAPPGDMGVRWPRAPLLDAAARAIELPEARAELGVTGRGATVCVVDTGVDVTLPDFIDAEGRSRVRWLLDLASPPRGAHPELEAELGGAVWSGEDIDEARAEGAFVPRDPHGHGTAVASVAAGDGASTERTRGFGPHAGIAPEASLVVVRALRPGVPGFRDADIVRGVRFCRDVSPGDGAQRTVVVLSLGNHDGAHDGSEPLSQALSAFAAEGMLLVAAAGNDGRAARHAAGQLYAGEQLRLPLWVPAPAPSAASRFVALAVLSDRHGPIDVAVEARSARTRWVSSGDEAHVDHDGGRLSVDGTMPARGPHRVHYVILSGGGDVPRPLSGGVYHLLLRGPGRFDAWIVGAELGPTFGRAHLDGPFASVRSSVTIPATAPGILAVGELVSRTRLRSDDAELETPGAIEGEVAPDASVGPARHGAPKPDLVAPGGWLVAARSGNLRADASFSLFGGSRSELRRRRVGDRVAVRGSSFAAPVAAGALALALELHPSRGAQDRALLRHTAARLTEAAWTASSGFGRLDVAAFLRARERLSHTEERASVRTPELALTRSALSVGRPSVFAVFRADAPTEATIAVAGPAGRTEGRLRAGTGAVPLGIPTALPGRSARFEAFVDGRSVATWDMPTRVDAARATVGTPGGGGCVVVYAGDGRPSRGPGAWLVAAWVAVVVLRRRRRSCVASETAEPPPRMRRSVG